MNHIFFNVLLVSVTFVITFRTVISELSDAVNQNSVESSYCRYYVFSKKIKTEKGNKSLCLYPYEEVIHQCKKCNHKVLWGSDTCNHGVECTEGVGYYVPRCSCLNTYYYGNNCDKNVYTHLSNKDCAIEIAVYFNKNIKDTHFYSDDVYVTTLHSRHHLQSDVETSEEFIVRFNKSEKFPGNKVRLDPHEVESERCYMYLEDSENVKDRPIVETIVEENVPTDSRYDGLVISAENFFYPNQRRSGQNHLLFSWECETSSGRKCYRFFSSNSRSVFVPSTYLIANNCFIYSATVTAPGHRPVSALQIIHILELSVSIECLTNCFTQVIANEEVILRASLSKNVSLVDTFVWTYKIKHESETWYSTDSLQDKSYPSDTLCIEPDSLEGGKTYLFRVVAVYKARVLISEIELNIARKPENGSCSVFPLRGVFAETVFNINCSGFVIDDAVLVYEYFDMDKSEEIFNGRIFSGRMLASNTDGKLDDVKLTRGVVVVVVNTMQGYSIVLRFEIELSSKNITNTDVDNAFVQIQRSLEVGRIHSVLRIISEVSDITAIPTSYIRPGNLYELLVDFESKVQIKGEDVKIGLSAIRNVVETLIGKLNHIPNLIELKETMKEKKRLSELFRINVVGRCNEDRYLARILLSELACTFVHLVEILFDETNVSLINKTDTSHVNFKILHDISVLVEEIFNDITYAISFSQSFRLKPYTVTTVSGLSTINSQSDSPSKLASRINREGRFNSKMAPPLVKTLQKYRGLTVHTITTKINPFLGEDYSVSTKLISLSLYGNKNTKSGMVRLTLLKQPIDIFLETRRVEFGEITLVAKKLDPTISRGSLDTEVPVVRIDLPEKCKLFIEFILPNVTTQLRVSVIDNLRPSYASVDKSPIVITSSSSTLDVAYNANDRRKFVYVGILPALNTPVGDAVEFTMRFYSNLCLSRIGYQWVPKFCSVGPLTNKSVVHCRCTHLSFFAASFIIPPNKVDPFREIYLVLTVKDNPLVLLYLLCLFVLFCLLYIWAVRNDKRDYERRKIIELEDNFPCDKNLYVVAVFTGRRFFSGTRANVGIQIDGANSFSRPHILKATGRQELRTNSDSWFLIRTPDRLGVLRYIYIWHDNSGPGPSWYCDKILIYDLKRSTVYTFFMERWLSIEKNEYPEAVGLPATDSEFVHLGRITLDNIVSELQHFHMFGRMFSSNKHNSMTRLDRVMIFHTTFVSATVVNIAYFNVDIGGQTGIEEHNFFFSTRYIYLSVQVLAITLIISTILDSIFRKSYILKSTRERAGFKSESKINKIKVYVRPSYVKPKKSAKLSRVFKHDTGPKLTLYQRFAHVFMKKSQPTMFLPVTLSGSSHSNNRKLKVYALAVTLSFLLIGFSFYLTLLYGQKLGYEQSKFWLYGLLTVMLQQYILVFPIKMFMVAIVLAHFQYLSPIPSYNVVVDDTYSHEAQNDYEFYRTLIEKRNNPIYYPLSDEKIAVFRKQREQMEVIFKMLQFVTIVIFLVIITKVCSIYWSPRTIYSNVHVRTMITGGADPSMINFADISNRSQLENYLLYVFGESDVVYNTKWYNGMELKYPLYVTVPGLLARDCVLTRLGNPILRQIRVVGSACHFPSVFKNTSFECIPAWRPDMEDTDDYNDKWTPLSWKPAKPNAWDYNVDRSVSPRNLKSPTGTSYHSGGYIAKLNLGKISTRLIVYRLVNDHWIDQLTRVVFVDLTFYNVNENMFTHLTLIAEQLPYGAVMTSTSSHSVHLHVYEILWSTSFSVYLLLLLVKVLFEMNRYGLFSYFLSTENAFQALIICLGILSVEFFVVNNVISSQYISEYDIQNIGKTFVFDKIIKFHKVSSFFATGLFCCLVVRLLSLMWLFGPEFSVVYVTLKTSTVHVTLIFFTILISTLLYEEIKYMFSDFSRSSASLVSSFIAHYNKKHIRPNALELAFFMWKRSLLIVFIVLLAKKYNRALNKQRLKPNKQFTVTFSQVFKG